MKRIWAVLLVLSLVLAGCSDMMDGSYHHVTGNEKPEDQEEEEIVSVSRYDELHSTLVEMIREGKESGIISMTRYDQSRITSDTNDAVREVLLRDPIGAYAVEDIQFELGTNGGQPAIAVTVIYRYSRAQIQKIRRVTNVEQMMKAVAGAIDKCEAGIVLYVDQFADVDFDLWVSSYGAQNPDKVMELPNVAASVYPEEGRSRVVELKFHYQNGRDVLKAMQSHVAYLFSRAVEQLGEEMMPQERFASLYSVLRDPERELEQETSITPAYSLLVHGVGDSRTVAQVFEALCKKAELDCVTVTGTKAGAPWYWNIVCLDGVYHHVDVLAGPAEAPQFLGDQDMSGYVWDYSAYPVCQTLPEPPLETEPVEPTGQAEE